MVGKAGADSLDARTHPDILQKSNGEERHGCAPWNKHIFIYRGTCTFIYTCTLPTALHTGNKKGIILLKVTLISRCTGSCSCRTGAGSVNTRIANKTSLCIPCTTRRYCIGSW